MEHGKPITPADIAAKKTEIIPAEVIEAFNRLIAQNFGSGRANIKQNDAIAAIVAATNCERHEVFEKGWLDVEDIFRAAGWHVEYDKPGFNETYEANFTFKARTK